MKSREHKAITIERVRELAHRWATNVAHDGGIVDGLNGRERYVLFEWVIAGMSRESSQVLGERPLPSVCAAEASLAQTEALDDKGREAVVFHIGETLGGMFAEERGASANPLSNEISDVLSILPKEPSLAWRLCEMAGWPS